RARGLEVRSGPSGAGTAVDQRGALALRVIQAGARRAFPSLEKRERAPAVRFPRAIEGAQPELPQQLRIAATLVREGAHEEADVLHPELLVLLVEDASDCLGERRAGLAIGPRRGHHA